MTTPNLTAAERRFYNLFAGSYEDSYREILAHRDIISAEQLREWWGAALHDAGKVEHERRVADLKAFAAEPDGKWARQALERGRGTRVGDVFTEAVDLLCARHGFARLGIEAECSAFGAWAECYPKRKEFGC